ncbi:MAG: quinone-dependent dihydroorotate dehydrogenase [Pseudomonadales bacterium]|nr:quinone-dependent dihydroorotate dehydrogenase [Pseudomonadales bacterium]
MLYSLLRPLLFMLEPERAHHWALEGLAWSERLRLAGPLFGGLSVPPPLSTQVMGLSFPNPLGLAAGLDKNGDYIDALATLGFGFIEVGTVTPRPQIGNPQPRLFRLPARRALINRMGFNNLGVDHLAARLAASRHRGIVGVNIGKNADTALERAVDDYLHGMNRLYPLASYITVNLSSPNTPGLRSLQEGAAFSALLERLKSAQAALATEHRRYVPLVIKIAPDFDRGAVEALGAQLLQFEVDGVIATNTTVSRQGVEGEVLAKEAGGLSGRPLLHPTNEVLRWLAEVLEARIPIIGCGGVEDAWSFEQKRTAGAQLVQLYTALIYQGPWLVRRMLAELALHQQRA